MLGGAFTFMKSGGTHFVPWEVAGYPGILEMELWEIRVLKAG